RCAARSGWPVRPPRFARLVRANGEGCEARGSDSACALSDGPSARRVSRRALRASEVKGPQARLQPTQSTAKRLI
ncbi:MAG: hypothetical protein ACK5Y8_10575, partial [Betaproteobacteria bacterium]